MSCQHCDAIVKAATTPPSGWEGEADGGLWDTQELRDAIENLVRSHPAQVEADDRRKKAIDEWIERVFATNQRAHVAPQSLAMFTMWRADFDEAVSLMRGGQP